MLWYVNKYLNVFLFLSHNVIFVVMNLTYPFTRVISCMKKHSNIVNHLGRPFSYTYSQSVTHLVL